MLRRKRAIAPSLSVQSTFNAWPHCRSVPYLWCIWYFPTLRHFLHGKYYGRKSTSNCSMVYTNGTGRLYHLNIRRLHPPSPLRNSPHNHRWHSMDHRTSPLRHRTRRCKLLGLYLPLHDLRNCRCRHHIQSHKYLHHHLSPAEPTRIGRRCHHASTSSWNRGYAGVRGYC